MSVTQSNTVELTVNTVNVPLVKMDSGWTKTTCVKNVSTTVKNVMDIYNVELVKKDISYLNIGTKEKKPKTSLKTKIKIYQK